MLPSLHQVNLVEIRYYIEFHSLFVLVVDDNLVSIMVECLVVAFKKVYSQFGLPHIGWGYGSLSNGSEVRGEVHWDIASSGRALEASVLTG